MTKKISISGTINKVDLEDLNKLSNIANPNWNKVVKAIKSLSNTQKILEEEFGEARPDEWKQLKKMIKDLEDTIP